MGSLMVEHLPHHHKYKKMGSMFQIKIIAEDAKAKHTKISTNSIK